MTCVQASFPLLNSARSIEKNNYKYYYGWAILVKRKRLFILLTPDCDISHMRLEGPGLGHSTVGFSKLFNVSGTSLKNRAIKVLVVTNLRGQTRPRLFLILRSMIPSIHSSIHPSTKAGFKEDVRSLELGATAPTMLRRVTEGSCQQQERNSPTPKPVSPVAFAWVCALRVVLGFLGCVGWGVTFNLQGAQWVVW